MNKFCLFFIFFIFIGFTIFSDNGDQEEVDFLLFLPDSSSQFADEEQAMVHLDNVARYLMDRNPGPGQIRVDGYAADAANNVDSVVLSRDRAVFVINELQRRGIPENLFSDPVAFGSVDFWGSNADENERSPNRRVIIILEGSILTSDTIEAFSSEVITPRVTIPEPSIRQENVANVPRSGFPWWLLLLLIPLLFLIIFLASKRKKEEKPAPAPVIVPVAPVAAAAGTVNEAVIGGGLLAVAAVPAAISYTTVNLEEEIRFRAYELYLERYGLNGDHYTDWCIAVIEVCARYESKGCETYWDESWWARCENKDD